MKVHACLANGAGIDESGKLTIVGGVWTRYLCPVLPYAVAGWVAGWVDLDSHEMGVPIVLRLDVTDPGGMERKASEMIVAVSNDVPAPTHGPFAFWFSCVAYTFGTASVSIVDEHDKLLWSTQFPVLEMPT